MSCRDVRVVYPKYLGIPVWMGTRVNLGRPENDIGTGGGVDCVTIAANVVGGIVDRKLLGRKNSVMDKSNRISFFIRKEAWYVTIETFAEEPAKEMSTEFVDKILGIR